MKLALDAQSANDAQLREQRIALAKKAMALADPRWDLVRRRLKLVEMGELAMPERVPDKKDYFPFMKLPKDVRYIIYEIALINNRDPEDDVLRGNILRVRLQERNRAIKEMKCIPCLEAILSRKAMRHYDCIENYERRNPWGYSSDGIFNDFMPTTPPHGKINHYFATSIGVQFALRLCTRIEDRWRVWIFSLSLMLREAVRIVMEKSMKNGGGLKESGGGRKKTNMTKLRKRKSNTAFRH